MEEWKRYKLEELTIDRKGHYGIGAPAIDYDDSKYTYLRITDINDDGTLNYTGLKSVDDPEASKYLLNEGDIVFARTGNSTGRTYFYEPDDGQFVYAGFLIKFSLDPQKVNPRFLKYYTHSKPYYDWVQSFDTGATRGNINAQTYGEMPIMLPSRDVQDRLVDLLTVIDNKIKLNNRINHNLEEQAQALYKSWFVDFEPFKDDRFVDSELGLIPEGWIVQPLSTILEYSKKSINPQKYPETIFFHYSLPAYDNSKEPEVQKGYEIMSNKFVVEDNMILFSKLNPRIKRIWYISAIPSNSICSTEFIAYKALDRDTYPFCWCYLNSDLFYEKIMSSVNGATGSHQRFHAEETLDICLPYNKVAIQSFSTLIKPMLGSIVKNEVEIRVLKNERDSLLPQLMNGKMTVND